MVSLFNTPYWRRVIRPRILTRDNYICQARILSVCLGYDGRQLSPKVLEIDHIKPRSEGGSDDDSNLRVACRPCNRYLAGDIYKGSRQW